MQRTSSDRPDTTESRGRPRSIRINHRLDRRVGSQNTSHQSSKEEDDIPKFDIPPAGKEASYPSFHAAVVSYCLAGGWIEAFTLIRADCIILDLHPHHKKGREGVCKLENAKSGHETGERTDILLDGDLRYIRVKTYLN